MYEILEFAELKGFINYKIKELSSGMKARIFFSASIIYDAELYVIDEELIQLEMHILLINV